MRKLFMTSALIAGVATASVAYAGYKEVEVKDGGKITGVVKFTGKVPPAIAISKDTEACGTSCADPGIEAKDGLLKGAVVYLRKVKEGKAFTDAQKKVVSDQTSCVFVPHVALVAEGGSVEFKNSDSVLHNVKANSLRNGGFNEGVESGKSITKEFKSGHDEIKVTCSVHDWMVSWVVVMDSPYYAVTDENGAFEIGDVPPGKYKLVVWHGKLEKECEVAVAGDKAEKQKSSGVKLEVEKGGEVKVEATYGG